MSYKIKFKEFKEHFDFLDFIQSRFDVISVGPELFINCPFHSERTPSCSVDADGFYCFGCHEHGDSLDFITKLYGYSLQQVITSTEFIGYRKDTIKRAATKRSVVTFPSVALVEDYHKQLLTYKNKIDYLQSRGLSFNTIKKAKLGWGNPISFTNFRLPRYTIPVYNERNKLVTIRYRVDPSVDDNSEPKYLGHPKTDSCLYNCSVLADTNHIVVVGSELDAAYMYYQLDIPTVSLPGENVFKLQWAEMFSKKQVLIWLDNDTAGKTGALRLYEILAPVAKKVQIYKWSRTYPNKYDVGDFIKNYGGDRIVDELNKYELESVS